MPWGAERCDAERELNNERHRQDLLLCPLVMWSCVLVRQMDFACCCTLLLFIDDLSCRLSSSFVVNSFVPLFISFVSSFIRCSIDSAWDGLKNLFAHTRLWASACLPFRIVRTDFVLRIHFLVEPHIIAFYYIESWR